MVVINTNNVFHCIGIQETTGGPPFSAGPLQTSPRPRAQPISAESSFGCRGRPAQPLPDAGASDQALPISDEHTGDVDGISEGLFLQVHQWAELSQLLKLEQSVKIIIILFFHR